MSKPIETETLWTLRSVTFGGNFHIYRPNGQRAGEVYSLADANQIVDALNRQSQANAHDDLLAACKMSLEWLNNLAERYGMGAVMDCLPNNTSGRRQLQAAIAKAEGRA